MRLLLATTFVVRIILFLAFALHDSSSAEDFRIQTEDIVKDAYSCLPSVLEVIINNPELDHEIPRQKPFLTRLLGVSREPQTRLEFINHFREVQFTHEDFARLMATEDGVLGPIYVNREVLADLSQNQSQKLTFSLILQTLVHELGRKVDGLTQGEKDSVARLVGAISSRWESVTSIANEPGDERISHGRVLLFSIPHELIRPEFEFIKFRPDRAQPTFAIAVVSQGQLYSITDDLKEHVDSWTSEMQTTWTDVNRFMLMIQPQINEMIAQIIDQLTKTTKGLVASMSQDTDQQFDMSGFESPEWKRFENSFREYKEGEFVTFEVLRVSVLPLSKTACSIVIQAKTTLNRTGVDFGSPKFEGLEVKIDDPRPLDGKILSVPSLVQIPLSLNGSGTWVPGRPEGSLRPDLDFKSIAQLRQISRSGDRVQLRVRIPGELSGHAAIRALSLQLKTSGGALVRLEPSLIDAAPIRGFVDAVFELTDELQRGPFAIRAESVLINQTQAFLLDRGLKVYEPPRPSFQLVPSEGLKEEVLAEPALIGRDLMGRVVKVKSVHPPQPMMLLNPGWLNRMLKGGMPTEMQGLIWADLDKFEIEITLPKDTPLKQVQLEALYDVVAGTKSESKPGEPPAHFEIVPMGDFDIPTWTQVDVKLNQSRPVLIDFDPRSAQVVWQDRRYERLRLSAKVLFQMALEPLAQGHGFAPPFFKPLRVKVIGSDLSQSIQAFPRGMLEGVEEGDCSDLLKTGRPFAAPK